MIQAKSTKSVEIPKSRVKRLVKKRKNNLSATHIKTPFSKALKVIKSASIGKSNNKNNRSKHLQNNKHESSLSVSGQSTEDCSLSANTITQGVAPTNAFKSLVDGTQINNNLKHNIAAQLLIVRECKNIMENFMRLQENSEEARNIKAHDTFHSALNGANFAAAANSESTTSVELHLPSSINSPSGPPSPIKPNLARTGTATTSSSEISSINYNDINAVFIEIINRLFHLNDKIPQSLLQHYSRNDKIYKKQMLRLFGDSYYDSQYALRSNGRNYSHNAESATDATRVRSERDAKYYKNFGKRHNRYIGKYTFEELLNRKESTVQLCQAFVEAKHSFIYQQRNRLCIRLAPIYYSHNKGSSTQLISVDSARLSYRMPKTRSKSQSLGQFTKKHFTKTSSVDHIIDVTNIRDDSESSTISEDAKDVVFNLNQSHLCEQNIWARRQAASIHSHSGFSRMSLPIDGNNLHQDETISTNGTSSSGTNNSSNNNNNNNTNHNDTTNTNDDRSYKLRAMDAMMKLNSFDFDVFEFDVLTSGQSISTLFPIIMEQLLFFDSGSNNSLRHSTTGHSIHNSNTTLSNNGTNGSDSSYGSLKNNEMIFNQDIVLNLISKLENNLYNDFNPLYNRIHTAQMLCDCYFWLNQFDSTMINSLLKQEDRLIVLISTLIINLGYPGIENSMLCSINHDLSQIYNNQFVTENYAIAQFFYILKHQSLNIFGNLQNKNKNKFKQIKKKIIQCVINSNQYQRSQIKKSMKESIDEKQNHLAENNSHRVHDVLRNSSSNGQKTNGIKRFHKKQKTPRSNATRFSTFASLWKNLNIGGIGSQSDLSAIALPADIADASKPDMLFLENKATASKRLQKLKRILSTKSLQANQKKGLNRQSISADSNNTRNTSIKKCFDQAKRNEQDKNILRDAIVHTSKYGYFCKNLQLHKEWAERHFQQQLIASNVFDQLVHQTSRAVIMNRSDFATKMTQNLIGENGFISYFQTFTEFIDSKKTNYILMNIHANNEYWSFDDQAKIPYQGQ